MNLFEATEWRIALALAIGLVIGAERERRKGQGKNRAAAGIRTFALVGLLGGVLQSGGDAAVVVAGGLVIGAYAIVAYALGDRSDPGLTTEVALILDYALGAYAQAEPGMAFGATLVATAILAFRERIHRVVSEVLTTNDLLDALVFGICAAVALPLLPNRALDPLGVLNPFVVWRLVVLVMAVTGAGYIARRLIGPRFGLAIAGLASGFVSSSATIHSMGSTARATPATSRAAIAGALASNVATYVQMSVLVSVTSPALFARLAWPLAAGGAVSLVHAGVAMARAKRVEARGAEDERAFRLRTALLFGLIVSAVGFGAALSARLLGPAGALVAAGLGGFADAHASGASLASLVASERLAVPTAALGVLLTLSTNATTKTVLAFVSGPGAFAWNVALGVAAGIAAAWGALLATAG